MYENRQVWPEKKTKMYSHLQELPSKYGVVALVKLEKVRSSQMLMLRKKLKDEVRFVSIKSKVTRKAFSTLELPGIKDLSEQITGQCMFMFTNMSPFKLNVLLAKNKIMLAARGGDKASTDVVVPAKNTGVAPGPMLTEFKEANIPTKIDQGTIWITKDTVAAKRGQVISTKLAALLGKLDIKPVEARIELESALEAGIIYKHDELFIDVEAFHTELGRAHQEAVSLSIEAGYVTESNITALLARGARIAKSLAPGYVSADTIAGVLQKAGAVALQLASAAKKYVAS